MVRAFTFSAQSERMTLDRHLKRFTSRKVRPTQSALNPFKRTRHAKKPRRALGVIRWLHLSAELISGYRDQRLSEDDASGKHLSAIFGSS